MNDERAGVPEAKGVRLVLTAAPFLEHGGERRSLRPPDAALLAWLALEGPTPRARLAALLWPESTSDAARNLLRQRLFVLRREAGIDVVEGRHTLALCRGVAHDLAAAEGVLMGVVPAWGDEMQAWIEAQAGRRLRQRRDALVAAADAAEAAREWPEALAAAERLVELEPLAELGHQRLMRLHYLAGDRAAALLAFDRCERLLKDEIGTRPDATTLALLDTLQAAQGEAAGGRGPLPASVLRPPRRVGRDAEWQALHGAWAAERVALVLGEGGLGKSRLLDDFAEARGRREGRMIVVGARPGDALLPYALLSRLLRALLARTAEPLAPGLRAELARVLPELGSATAPGGGSDTTRFLNAVEAVLRGATEGGLEGVAVDDLHLADDASVELLLGLAARPGPRWLMALRPAERRPSLRDRLETFVRLGAVDEIELRSLAVADVDELLDSLRLPGWSGDGRGEGLHRRVGGNPMFLLETLRASLATPRPPGHGLVAVESLPAAPGVGRVILRRIEALSSPAVKLARCAAVAGQDFSARLAAEVLHVPALDLADAWNELETADLMRDGAFAHDLIHEAALASVPRPIAREMHDQVARSLEAASGEPARIAFHWKAAGQPRRAAPHLQAAGLTAARRFRYLEAAACHEEAGAIFEQAGQRAAAFDAWFSAADAIGAVEDRERMNRQIDRLDALAASDKELGLAAVMRTSMDFAAGRFDAVLTRAGPGIAAAQRSGDREVESELTYMVGLVHWERREVLQALPLVGRALSLRRGLDPAEARIEHVATLVTMTQAYGTMLAATGRFQEAEGHVLDAVAIADAAGQALLGLGSAAEMTVRRVEAGDLPGALSWVQRALAPSRSPEANAGDRARFEHNALNTLMQAARWGEAFALGDELQGRMASLGARACDAAMRWAQFQFAIGRRDLALRTLNGEWARAFRHSAHELMWSLAGLALGQSADTGELLGRIVAIDDIALRTRLLIRLAPHADPREAAPVLGLVATTIRDVGADGLWLSLQASLAARLVAAGRVGKARTAALAAWQRIDAGTSASHFFPEVAADLARALAPSEPALAATVVARGMAWLGEAVGTLPEPWRENAESRSPLRDGLVAARALLPPSSVG